jgi:hypothetical protein
VGLRGRSVRPASDVKHFRANIRQREKLLRHPANIRVSAPAPIAPGPLPLVEAPNPWRSTMWRRIGREYATVLLLAGRWEGRLRREEPAPEEVDVRGGEAEDA